MKFIIVVLAILISGCTIKISQVLPGDNTTSDVIQTDQADVSTDADVPISGGASNTRDMVAPLPGEPVG